MERGLILRDCFREAPIVGKSYAEIMVRKVVAAGHIERVTKERLTIPPILDLCFA